MRIIRFCAKMINMFLVAKFESAQKRHKKKEAQRWAEMFPSQNSQPIIIAFRGPNQTHEIVKFSCGMFPVLDEKNSSHICP